MSSADRRMLSQKSHDELADYLANYTPGTPGEAAPRAEFLLRQTQFIERQAIAAERAAQLTRRYTTYMLLTAIATFLTALATAVFH